MKNPKQSGIIMIIIGVVVIGFGVYSYTKNKEMNATGKDTKGVVVDIDKRYNNNTRTTSSTKINRNRTTSSNSRYKYYPTIKYGTEEGDTFKFEAAGVEDRNRYEIGDEVTVVYDPDDPKKAKIKVSAETNKKNVYMMGGIGLLVIVIGVFVLRKNS